MGMWFDGFSASQRGRLKAQCERAMKALDWDTKLTVKKGLPDDEPAQANAVALAHGIFISPKWLDDADEGQVRAVMYEEVAHKYFGELGVPHEGPLAVLHHEAFATWFSFAQMAIEDSLDWNLVKTTAIPKTPTEDQIELVYWMVGKQAGAALAGSEAARNALSDWCSLPHTDWVVGVAKLGAHLLKQDLPPGEANPVEVAEQFSNYYHQLAASAETR